MKKIMTVAAAVAMTAMTMVSCDGDNKADLKDGVDSLAYDLGVFQSEGLKQYMAQLGVDSAYYDDFFKGMKEGAVNEVDPKKEAYLNGLAVGKDIQGMAKNLGHQVYGEDTTKTVNVKTVIAGLIAGLKGTDGRTAEQAYHDFDKKLEPIREVQLLKDFGGNKAAGEKYLAENKKKEGVKVTKSGLQYKVLVEGTGALPTDSSQIQVNYEGKLIDGTVFDSSYERNMPYTVDMSRPHVIKGWIEALKMMPAGSKWEVTIPQELGYGSQNQGPIKPFSTLIFTIEVLK
ncbi:MAG: FKBP-type peptidyl-prolyl cis-trans isomerase [Bacteroidaceae bacterium]|nr:FKBP-type peptidyl-prolyl cis-trans isomerase [Bacteroidaceae bacterium]MDD7527763.1 FKBP-type peptidyl-prolyl cis-trans isomerase [Prevotellaceae bacterium]MDY5760823.1 FKBP-type peptidyl-prolyl cis-trans isomerase [Bacteroidaceae bacterium]